MTDMTKLLSELNKTSRRSVALYHRVALAAGVSDSALGVLYALSTRECTQYELCGELSIPKQTVNTAVAALQKSGLISLSPASGARNKKTLALTDAGRAFAQNTVARLRAAELDALAALTPEERELYVALNKKYNGALAGGIDALAAPTGEQ